MKNKYKICISGAAGGECFEAAKGLAYDVGREVARQGAVLVTGATTGIPHQAARGARDAGGMVIGFSPAATIKEHVKKYRLPTDSIEVIVFTGFGYAGRNLLLTRSSDAVILVCGRIGTLNEFTIAFEDKKIIGILASSGGMSDELPHILRVAKRGAKNIIFDPDPHTLIKKVLAALAKNYEDDGIRGKRKKNLRKRGEF
ncbi:MAG: hypothetical protein AAB731_01190 [Patescibacteria group bacterium]